MFSPWSFFITTTTLTMVAVAAFAPRTPHDARLSLPTGRFCGAMMSPQQRPTTTTRLADSRRIAKANVILNDDDDNDNAWIAVALVPPVAGPVLAWFGMNWFLRDVLHVGSFPELVGEQQPAALAGSAALYGLFYSCSMMALDILPKAYDMKQEKAEKKQEKADQNKKDEQAKADQNKKDEQAKADQNKKDERADIAALDAALDRLRNHTFPK